MVLVFGIVVAVVWVLYLCITRIGGEPDVAICDQVTERVWYHESSLWLRIIKVVGIDTTGQMCGRHCHFDRPLAEIPLNFLFHELGGHFRRWLKAPHLRWPKWLKDPTRSVTMYFDYFRKPKEDEDEAERLEYELLENAKPELLSIPVSRMDRFAKAQSPPK